MHRILVVEDEKALARALELKLIDLGYEVVVVTDGKEALKEINKNKFDLILLDLVLPIMDGFKVLTKLRANHIKIPIIVLTNLSQEEDRVRALSLGAKNFFVKSETPISHIVSYIKNILK